MSVVRELIGLYSSAPQSGKTTVAMELERRGFARVPFADPLKGMVVRFLMALGYPKGEALRLVHIDKSAEIPQLGVTVRHLLQTLGTEWGRNCVTPDVWLKCWKASATQHLLVVADDVRFPNEAQLIKSMGGQIWRIERPGLIDTTGHVSEGGLRDWVFDRVIVNNGTVEDMIRDLS
jgi:hypothetical protein